MLKKNIINVINQTYVILATFKISPGGISGLIFNRSTQFEFGLIRSKSDVEIQITISPKVANNFFMRCFKVYSTICDKKVRVSRRFSFLKRTFYARINSKTASKTASKRLVKLGSF